MCKKISNLRYQNQRLRAALIVLIREYKKSLYAGDRNKKVLAKVEAVLKEKL